MPTGSYRLEAWELYDRSTGRTLGTRSSGSLKEAAEKRASLVKLAGTISPECQADTDTRTDIRKAVI